MNNLLLLAIGAVVVWTLTQKKKNGIQILHPHVEPKETLQEQLQRLKPDINFSPKWVRVGGRPMVQLPDGKVVEFTEAGRYLTRHDLRLLGPIPPEWLPTSG